MRSNALALSLLLSRSLLVSVHAKHLLLYAYTSFVSDLVLAKLGAVSKSLGKLLLFARLLTGCILHRHVAIITKPSPPFPVHDVVLVPGILPIFFPWLRDKIWEWPGTRLWNSRFQGSNSYISSCTLVMSELTCSGFVRTRHV